MRHAPLLVRMLFWRVTLPVARRFVAAERLARFLARPRLRPSEDVSTAVRIASRLWRSADGPCLERSLALYHELGRLGASPELVLGVAKEGDRVLGHAWVEVNGRPLLDSIDPNSQFPGIVRFRADGRGTVAS